MCFSAQSLLIDNRDLVLGCSCFLVHIFRICRVLCSALANIISSEEKGKLSGHSQGMTSVTSILYGLLLNFVIRNPHDCFSVVIM